MQLGKFEFKAVGSSMDRLPREVLGLILGRVACKTAWAVCRQWQRILLAFEVSPAEMSDNLHTYPVDMIDADRVNWDKISLKYKLAEPFIARYACRVNWAFIIPWQTLSEEFIEEFCAHINWLYISANCRLSEAFITRHADKVNWQYIVKFQSLSEEFILANLHRLYWGDVLGCQKPSARVRLAYMAKINGGLCEESI
jgi:hypothetical protein